MAAEEKLALPNTNFFAAVKYHVVGGSLQDQVCQEKEFLAKSSLLL
jgi:hypothetical protein